MIYFFCSVFFLGRTCSEERSYIQRLSWHLELCSMHTGVLVAVFMHRISPFFRPWNSIWTYLTLSFSIFGGVGFNSPSTQLSSFLTLKIDTQVQLEHKLLIFVKTAHSSNNSAKHLHTSEFRIMIKSSWLLEKQSFEEL